MPDNYTVVETVPTAEAFCRLREISGLSPRPLEAARKALPGSCYGMHILCEGKPVGMGRIVGDGALNFDIVDVAVDLLYQGQGLGRVIMETLVAWLDNHACKGAYVCLMADVPELYAKFGFTLVRPASEGMARIW